MNKGINVFATFPLTVIEVLTSRELAGLPPTFTRYLHLDSINRLDRDVFGLNAFLGSDRRHWEVRLFNFRDDTVIHRWKIQREDFVETEYQFTNSEPRNCILLTDRSLIAACEESQNLFRLDRDSKIVWHNTCRRFHHALNLAPDGNIWTCTAKLATVKVPLGDETLYYRDENITKIDVETGQVLVDKSVSAILLENGYANLIFGFANRLNTHYDRDPLHLNEIEPVFNDGPHWKTDDLFISLRHRSLVIHYRPSTNKIVRLIYGPFLNQHDVDIISENEICIFNNNGSLVGDILEIGRRDNPPEPRAQLHSSHILIYDYRDSEFRTLLEHHFRKEKIYTHTQGLQHRLSNGDFYVESQNDGIMYFMNDDTILYKRQFPPTIGDWTERPHWIRIYEDIDF